MSPAISSAQLNNLITTLQSEALPRLIDQYGMDQGLQQFNNRVNTMLQALGLGSVVTKPVLGQTSADQYQSTSPGGILGGIFGQGGRGAGILGQLLGGNSGGGALAGAGAGLAPGTSLGISPLAGTAASLFGGAGGAAAAGGGADLLAGAGLGMGVGAGVGGAAAGSGAFASLLPLVLAA